MSDAQDRGTNWNDQTLKAYFDQQFSALSEKIDDRFDSLADKIEALDRLTDSKFVTFKTMVDSEAAKVALALSSADKAVTKAEVANEERFRAVNEFRSQMVTQMSNFVTRIEIDATHDRINERVQDLTDRMNKDEGQNVGSATAVAKIITIVTIVMTILIFLINFYFDSRGG